MLPSPASGVTGWLAAVTVPTRLARSHTTVGTSWLAMVLQANGRRGQRQHGTHWPGGETGPTSRQVAHRRLRRAAPHPSSALQLAEPPPARRGARRPRPGRQRIKASRPGRLRRKRRTLKVGAVQVRPRRSAASRSAPSRSASSRSASRRSAACRQASRSQASCRSARRKSAPGKGVNDKPARCRSAPARCSRPPGGQPSLAWARVLRAITDASFLTTAGRTAVAAVPRAQRGPPGRTPLRPWRRACMVVRSGRRAIRSGSTGTVEPARRPSACIASLLGLPGHARAAELAHGLPRLLAGVPARQVVARGWALPTGELGRLWPCKRHSPG
jgi:hypothetical protein